jgi:hypothetical protein
MHTPSYVLVIAVLLLSACGGSDANHTLKHQDAAIDTLPAFPNTAQGRKLKQHVYTMSGYGENAENVYQQSLNELKKECDDSTEHEDLPSSC